MMWYGGCMLTNTDFLHNAFVGVALGWVAAAVVGILVASGIEYVVNQVAS